MGELLGPQDDAYPDYPFPGLRDQVPRYDKGAPVPPLALPGRTYERNAWPDHLDVLDDPFPGKPLREDSGYTRAVGTPAPPPVGTAHPPPGPHPTAAMRRAEHSVGIAYR